ncbi:hypothetical protein [Aliiroseovarius sp.]|uniref:hypothetical protein n=1 Tax=Aliiroseovarius sp. TaxID=1872442 RepID=UPI003BA943D9
MIEGRHQIKPRLILAVLFSLLLTGQTAAQCILTAEVGRLVEAMESAMARPDGISSSDAADLYRRAQRVSPPDVADRLREAGYPANTHAVDMLIREARTVAQNRLVMSQNVTRLRLRRVEKLRERVCAAEARLEMAGNGSKTHGGAGPSGDEAGLFTGSGGAGNVALRLGMVPVTLVSVVGTIYLMRLGYVWIFALLFNRRKCWVPARLKIGVDVIPGHMSILGRKGCRFQPESPELSLRMEAQAPCIDAHLIVNHLVLPARLEAVHEGFGVVYFGGMLGPGTQKSLLAKSRIEPTLVPKSTPRPKHARTRQPRRSPMGRPETSGAD